MDIVLDVKTKVVTLRYRNDHVALVISGIARNIAAILNVIEPAEGDLFYFITAYINECLSEVERQALIDQYKSIDEIAQTLDDLLPVRLTMVVEEIQNIINYDRLLNWVINNKAIVAPPDIRTSYDTTKDTEGLIAPDKTYITEEYRRLCAYTLMSRMVAIAIHGFDNMLSDYYRAEIKPQVYFDMLDGTPLRTSDEFMKLYKYVETNRDDNFQRNQWAKDAFYTAMSLRGIPEDAIDSYVMGVVVLNTISAYPILETLDNKNLVKKIYRTAVYTINNVSSGISDNIRITRISGSDIASDDSQSVLESHRVSSRITIGTIVEIQHYYSDPIAVFMATSKEPIDMDLYNMLLSDIDKSENIRRGQLSLTSGILGSVIRAEVLLYIEKEVLFGYMVIAALLALRSNHKEVAKLILSMRDPSPQHVLASPGNIRKPDDSVVSTINKILPYFNNIYTVKKTPTSKSTGSVDLLSLTTKDLLDEAMITRTSEQVNATIYGDKERAIWVPTDMVNEFVTAIVDAKKLILGEHNV